MKIISRANWGARHDRGFAPAPLPAAEVWLHHSVTIAPDLGYLDADRDGVDDDEERAMRTLEQIGEDRFGGGISYTWLVMPSGRIYDGHGVDRQGAHTGGRNDISRAICLVGNYDTHRPTEAQIRSAAWLLRHAKRKGWIRHARLNGGHRDLKATACPGRHAYADIGEINRLAAGGPISEPITEEDELAGVTDAVLDIGYRLLDLLHLRDKQTGGKGKGDELPLVTHLAALIWRVEALVRGRDVVAGGPRKGEPVEANARAARIESKLDRLLAEKERTDP